jgi:uncharacterized protein YoxC
MIVVQIALVSIIIIQVAIAYEIRRSSQETRKELDQIWDQIKTLTASTAKKLVKLEKEVNESVGSKNNY